MRGVLLAGGTGSRLAPLTTIANKHVLPVWNRPMVEYPLDTLVRCGVRDVLVVTGGEHPGDLLRLLGNGSRYGCRIRYAYQDGAGGIADALGLADDGSSEGVVVILGDNVFERAPVDGVGAWMGGDPRRAMVFLREVPDPWRFGVAVRNEENVIRFIAEKPARHLHVAGEWEPGSHRAGCFPADSAQPIVLSHAAVTGLYCYPPDCFARVKRLKPSARGELEVTDLNLSYLADGLLDWRGVEGEWTDAGTFESLARASELARKAAP